MSLLTPWFLAGLAALAVPILVHLIHRERKDVVTFPSLMFLQRIPYKSVRRNQIRHWALFLLRCAALILLVLAFARPLFDRDAAAATTPIDGAREVVILLDRSYSMGYGDRWERARAEARRVADGMGPQDRATLVTFAERAEAVTSASTDPAAVRAAIDAVELGSGRTRYGPALKLAEGVLEESTLPRREVVLITDFQRVGWDGDDDDVRLPARTTLTHVDLSADETENAAVTGVMLSRDYSGDRERIAASARLTNTGGTERRVNVALELNGRELERKEVTLPPTGAASVSFEAFALPAGISRGTVRAGSDALPQDNAFHFVLSAGQALNVLVVDQRDAPASRSLYLRRAMAIGDRPPIRAEAKRSNALAPADFQGRALVVLNDVAIPGGATGRAIRDFVERGGGVFIALGERTAANAFGEGTSDLVPAIGAVVDRTGDRGATLAFIDYGHPALELFSAPRSGDFSSARFYRYRAVTPAATDRVLARFDDGGAALVERRVGNGRVLVWTSSLDTFWSDLPVQPVYLPLVHQIAKHASGFAEARPWVTVGQVVDVSPEAEGMGAMTRGAASELVLEAPSGTSRRIAADSSGLLEMREQGFYQVRRIGARPGADRRVIAVNLDLAESDLSAIDPQELITAVSRRQDGAATDAALASLTPIERERRQSVWWFLLAGALLALGAETVLANRLSRVPVAGA